MGMIEDLCRIRSCKTFAARPGTRRDAMELVSHRPGTYPLPNVVLRL